MSDGAPNPQLVLRCALLEIHDGDTLTAEVRLRVQVRLLDCWAPELRGPERAAGLASRDHLRAIVGPLPAPARLVIPLGGTTRLDDLFTFGRILGHMYLDGDPRSLSEHQVAAGMATTRKDSR